METLSAGLSFTDTSIEHALEYSLTDNILSYRRAEAEALISDKMFSVSWGRAVHCPLRYCTVSVSGN